MRFDRKRWEAAFEAWRARRWFERALTARYGPEDSHLENDGPDMPQPEPALCFRVCRGCGVEYIPSTLALQLNWEPDSPWQVCDFCDEARRFDPARPQPPAHVVEAARRARIARRAKAARKADLSQRRANAAKSRARHALTATLRRILARRAAESAGKN